MNYRSKLIMHMNFGPKGSTMVHELVDHPGVQISDFWNKKTRKNERSIIYKNLEYKTIAEAVEAHKKDQHKSPGGKHAESRTTEGA